MGCFCTAINAVRGSDGSMIETHQYENDFILHLSDIHLDTLYAIGSATNCLFDDEGLTCCRNSSIPKHPPGYALPWGDFNCDLNQDTFQDILHSLDNLLNQDINNHINDHVVKPVINNIVLLITGDIASHHDFDIDDSLRAITRFTEMLVTWMYDLNINTTVVPVLGNHDARFVDQEWETGSPFLQTVSKLWTPWLQALSSTFETNSISLSDSSASSLLPATPLQTFSYAGYYCTTINGRVWIVLNSLWYDPNNFVTRIAHDPGQQWVFLDTVLQQMPGGAKAFIALHIPPSTDTIQLNEILCRHVSKIERIFAGHTHHDQFRLLQCAGNLDDTEDKSDDRSGIPIFIAPSMQTSHHLPSIRLYTTQTFLQYHLPFNESNLVSSYNLKDYFNTGKTNQTFNALTFQAMQKMYHSLCTNNTALQMYNTWFNPINSRYCDASCANDLLNDILIRYDVHRRKWVLTQHFQHSLTHRKHD